MWVNGSRVRDMAKASIFGSMEVSMKGIDFHGFSRFWKNDQPCGMGRLIYFNGNR